MYTNYKKFILESLILENLKNMKFILSKNLIEILKKIDHEISDELINLHNNIDSESKQTFIDIGDDDNKFSFIQSNKAAELLNINDEIYDKIDKSILFDINGTHDVYNKHRGEMKIGRFINTIFGSGKFPISKRSTDDKKPNDIESFIRIYKSLFDQDNKFSLFEIISGDEIAYWYNKDNSYNDEGTLGESCMNDVPDYYFDLYCKNPNEVSMLILYSDHNKNLIEGRAILWKLHTPANRTFMERAYTNDSSKEELFLQYAKKNKWMHKKFQSYGHDEPLVDTITGWNGHKNIKCKLTNVHFDHYPYVDTMQFINLDEHIISNEKNGMEHSLITTDGELEEIYWDDSDTVYSNYYNDDIRRGDARWCEYGEDWVYNSDAIYVFNSGGKYAVPDHPDVVNMKIPSLDIDKHFLKDKCIWSDYLFTWVFKSSAVKVWKDKEKTEYVIDYKKREDNNFVEIEGEYYIKK